MTSNNSRAVRTKPLQCVAIRRALLLVINAMSQPEKSMEHVDEVPRFQNSSLKLVQIYSNFTFLCHITRAAVNENLSAFVRRKKQQSAENSAVHLKTGVEEDSRLVAVFAFKYFASFQLFFHTCMHVQEISLDNLLL